MKINKANCKECKNNNDCSIKNNVNYIYDNLDCISLDSQEAYDNLTAIIDCKLFGKLEK